MKKFIRLIALLMLGVMLLTAFASCADEGDKQTDDSDGNTVETAGLDLAIPREDNGGETVKILYTQDLAEMEVSLEYSDDVVAAAMFVRDVNVKDHLGITLEYFIEDGSWAQRNAFNQKIQASVQASTDYDYDMLLGYSSCSLISNATMGCFKNMYDYKDILAFEEEWWLDSLDEYVIDGKLYNVYSDASLSLYSQMAVIFFNQEIVKNYDLPSPYDLVKNDDWTYEKMLDIAKGVSENLDDTPEISYENDLMGYLQYEVSARGWLTALDIALVNKAADGTMSIAQSPSEKLINVYKTFYDLFSYNSNCYSGAWDDVAKCFKDGRALFMNGFLTMISSGDYSFASMTDDWGLVPVPKYDAEQEDYKSPLGSSAGMWCIMTNARSPELCAKTLEVMSYFTHANAVDEYYVRTLGEQRARDKEVASMLEIVRNTSTLTFEAVYNNAFDPNMYNLLQMNESWRSEAKVGQSVSTYWGANYRAWRANLTTLITDFSK